MSSDKPKALRAKYLFIIAVVSYALAFVLSTSTLLGSGFALLGLVTLLFSIIAFFRERKARKSVGVIK